MAKLVDVNGRPIDLAALRQPIANPTLTGVRQPVGASVSSGLTPERLAQLLRNAEGGNAAGYLALAEEMEEKYLHYSSELATRKRAVAGLAVQVLPAGEDKTAEAAALLVRQCLPLIQARLPDLLDAVGKGFSVLEIDWDTSGKQWLPRALEWRDPRWFQFARADGRTLLLRDERAPDGLPLAPYKFIQHRAAAKSGLPIRGGLARPVAWAYLFSNYSIKDWLTFAEVYGQPLRLGKYGPTATDDDIATLIEAVRGIGTDAAAVIPDSMLIEFKENSGKAASADLYERLVSYMDRQVSKVVLGQTLATNTSQSGGGAYALGQVHNEVRLDIVKADAAGLAASLSRDLLRPLVDLNLGPQAAYPQLRIDLEEPEDLNALAGHLRTLHELGLPIKRQWVYDKFAIPAPEAGDVLLGDQAAAGAPPATQRRYGSAHSTQTVPTPASPAPDPLDDLAELALEGWQPQLKPLTHPLVAELAASLQRGDSLQQFSDRLPGLLAQMDVTNIAQRLAEADFMALLAGRAGIDLGGE
ncbi:DUF935 domain-containing protein [Parachitinimonas caeni]|uniref:DUF935 domain-containing protein n=1 Tax=Parachitinimonas caeni TaxID=3031301 RepID=A0ABT7DWS8_9NEIS|nr:DUF935 domain-containing protein [Parachitinimonas caeni]MDK2124481.1 DUF935 domain-containing protein [Parachitinimonas caeni]